MVPLKPPPHAVGVAPPPKAQSHKSPGKVPGLQMTLMKQRSNPCSSRSYGTRRLVDDLDDAAAARLDQHGLTTDLNVPILRHAHIRRKSL